jgi:NAD+ synthase
MTASAERIAGWLARQVASAGARGLVVGLSGGLDSAVVLRLCQMAVGERAVAVILPCHSDTRDEADALMVAQQFGVPAIGVDLSLACDGLLADLGGALAALPRPLLDEAPAADPEDPRAPRTAMKPRLRMTALCYVADTLSFLVAGTATRSDLVVGAFTKYGDAGVDVLPLGGLLKREVRVLAASLGIPRAILDKPPGRGLFPGQTDERDLGFKPEDLERYLELGPEGVSPALAMRIERLIRRAERLRDAAPIPE